MRILLLSAYDAASHKRWREALVAHLPEHDWTVLALPPRYFSWRIRGNSLSWALGQRELLMRPYDMIIATSMVDLSALKGLVPALADVPSLYYFHENQFAYPASGREFASVEPQLVNLYGALAADRIGFNSDYNRQSFLRGVDTLLRSLPDQIPPGIVDLLEARSSVLPVPLEGDCFEREPRAAAGTPLSLVWNHRWEYDKGPERFFAAVRRLLESGQALRLFVLGQSFRSSPAIFAQVKAWLESEHPQAIAHWGFVEQRGNYLALLRQADVVVSTALHDFQGLSVLEAAASGCRPVVPDRLCYGEWFAPDCRYPSYEDDADAESAALAAHLLALAKRRQPSTVDVLALGWPVLVTRYRELLECTASRGRRGDQPL